MNPSAGHFVEVVPDERVVFTFGWDLPGHPIPAGSTEVEITLEPVGSSTLLRLVHRGLPDDAVNDHLRGWDYYLGRLLLVCDGDDPGPDSPHLGDRTVSRHGRPHEDRRRSGATSMRNAATWPDTLEGLTA